MLRTNLLTYVCMVLLIVSYFFATSPFDSSLAQRAPSSLEGKSIAEKLCSSCHIIGTSASGVVKADVPSFTSIANRPDQTAEQIVGRIVIPHKPMPDLQLTRLEIADVAAYILTLQKSD